jgi:hypothetical protein
VGLLDFLRRGSKPSEGPPVDRKFAGLAKTAADKHAQNYDRDEAIRALCLLGTPQAARALLKRFNFQVDPSINDQEEKELAFDGIVRIGTGALGLRPDGTTPKNAAGEPLPLEPAELDELRTSVVDAVRGSCERAESLSWPIRLLRELLDDVAFEDEVLRLLDGYDTEYMRNVEPKVNLIAALEGIISPAARLATERYLDDVNESVRFQSVETIFKQADAVSVPGLVKLVLAEESVRVKNKVAEGLVRLGWAIPTESRDAFAEALADSGEYRLGADGKVRKA